MTTTAASFSPSPDALKRPLWKPTLAMVGVVVVLVAIIGGTKFVQISKIIAQSKAPQPPVVVTALTASMADWQPQISAFGSTKAVRGVDLTTEVGGLVSAVLFKPGQEVPAGAVLVKLNDDADVANLQSLQATADLAATTLARDRAQLAVKAVSQAQVDSDEADLRSKRAQVAQQAALVAKKTIRAPFAGRVGLTTVNPGQYLNPGDKIASLETVSPIYVDFPVSQDQLPALAIGQEVTVTTQSLPGEALPGTLTAIDSKVDQTTRVVTAEATIVNPGKRLLPGMYVSAAVTSGAPQRYITIPQTAVTFNPYGSTVFTAVKGKDASGQEALIAQQNFVKTGSTRGDQIAVLSGLKAGDLVITSGQLKLKNGSPVKVDNHVSPSDAPAPEPQEQ